MTTATDPVWTPPPPRCEHGRPLYDQCVDCAAAQNVATAPAGALVLRGDTTPHQAILLTERVRELEARVAELERRLDAVGAFLAPVPPEPTP